MDFNNNTAIIIPARYKSTRLPGKPLIPILGRELVLRVADIASEVLDKRHIYIATDDERIYNLAVSNDYQSIKTSSKCLTGTDRVAEAASGLSYDVYINLQGDEPMLAPQDILRCIQIKKSNPDFVVNSYHDISKEEDPASKNIPKVLVNEKNQLIYMSRNLIPGFKNQGATAYQYKKQVCIYGFNSRDLELFTSLGRKSRIELIEDIEILRFLDLDKKILMYESTYSSLAVDIEDDIKKVELAIQKVDK